MKKFTLMTSLLLAASASAAVPFQVTTITDGKFADDTKWYMMQIKGSLLHAEAVDYPVSINGSTTFADSDFWCFTGSEADGFTIYNKAYGTSMMLGAPSNPAAEEFGANGQTAYAEVMAPGKEGYSYNWTLTPSTHVDGAYYVNITGNASAILNNRDGNLAFWTKGKDAGSSIIFYESAVEGSVSGNVWTINAAQGVSLSSTDGGTASMKDGVVSLGAGTWKFTLPEGKVIDAGFYATADGEKHNLNGYPYEKNDITIQGPVEITSFDYLLTDIAEETPHGYAVFRMDRRHPKFQIVYRIPAIACIETGEHAGRLIALNDYRYCGGDIGGGRIDLHISISDDNGLTWSQPDDMRNADGKPVARGTGAPGNVITNLDCGYGDPAIVTDRETGEVFVIACCGRQGFHSSRRDNPQPSARWWSKDGGKTWSEPDYGQWEQIYALFDDNCPNGYIDSQFIGSGRMIQSKTIKVGDYYRIYAVNSGKFAANGNISNWVLYSDDFGHNWHILGDPYNPAVSAGGDEPKCEELPDGSVLLAARGNGGNRNFNIFRYTDIAKAEGSWGQHINTNLGLSSGINACNGEILIVPVKDVESGDHHYLALQSYPAGPGRKNVSIAWKAIVNPEDYDEPSDFSNWGGHFQVSDMDSAYSTMCLQKDNKVGFIFEECTFNNNGYTEMYYPLSIETITGGKYEYCADDDFAVSTRMAKEMMNHRMQSSAQPSETGYVGTVKEVDFTQTAAAVADYEANPSPEAIASFNSAIASDIANASILPEAGKSYHFMSAHDGAYNYPTDRYLSMLKSSKKISTATKDNLTTTLFTLEATDDGEHFRIYNANADAYFPATHTTTEKEMNGVSKEEAAPFDFVSDPTGHTSIVCATPGNTSYPAFHLKSANGTVVIWTVNAGGSKWYMIPVEDESVIEEINADTDADEKFFDLSGRQVVSPRSGSIYVTSKNRKVIL